MDEIQELHLEKGQKDQEGVNDKLINSMRQRLEALPDSETKCTIFRVPENIRKGKESLFEPAVVSIGPYHRGKQHLRAMEEKKWPLLRDYLSWAKNNVDNNITLESCIREMRALEKQARRCYNETIDMDSDSFVEMLLLDGSFLLIYILGIWLEHTEYVNAGWSVGMIRRDLMLIENQLPFFILEALVDFEHVNMGAMVKTLLGGYHGFVSTNIPPPRKEINHLLHLYHYYSVPANTLNHESLIFPYETRNHTPFCPSWMLRGPKLLLEKCLNLSRVPNPDPIGSVYVIPCATELQEAGVELKKKKSPCNLTKVTFQSGILEIPLLEIGDDITVFFMNLVALEQCEPQLPQVISTYLMFMDKIVNTTNDVAILERQGIINNMLSGEEEVALFINQSCQGVWGYDNHYLADMFKEVNKYCGSRKHRYRAKLMRDYFNNPWSMLSLFGAIFLLLLTSTQTFYAAFAYHRPPN